jgi:phage terminase small subunit
MASTQNQLNDPNSPLSGLTDRQKQFCLFVSEGKPIKTALRLAGYSENSQKYNGLATRIMQNPQIIKAVHHLHKRYENAIVASRKTVLEGFLDAIEQAKLMSDPAVQIAGWREIGKMCGYYAPEVKEVNINVGAKRVIGQLEVMSDQELLDMIEKDREAIEGTALQLTEQADDAESTGTILDIIETEESEGGSAVLEGAGDAEDVGIGSGTGS